MKTKIFIMLFCMLKMAVVQAKSEYVLPEHSSNTYFAAYIRPLDQPYPLEPGDQWTLLYENTKTQFYQSNASTSDTDQMVGAWIKQVDQDQPYTISYYLVWCRDKKIRRLEQYRSNDDVHYQLVKHPAFYRQVQAFHQVNAIQPMFEALCKSAEGFHQVDR